MRGLVAITAAFVVVGCSIGALEGFSGGASDADSGPPATDGPANADVASTADGRAANDARGDAPSDAANDGGAGAFTCDGGAYLVCATFDQGAVAASWTSTELAAGGTLGLSGDHRSAPSSMRAQLPAMTAEQNQLARVYAKWIGARALRISFDVKIATPQWGQSTEAFALLHVIYPSTTNESYLFRSPTETTLSIEQNAVASRYQKVQDLPYDAWVRVTLEVVPTTPTGTLRLRYDGVTVYENAAVSFGTPTAPETYVFLGLARFNPPSPAVDVLYDNVTIEQIP